MTEFHHEPDACGLNCPSPVLRAKKTLDKMASGEVLQIIATDLGSVEDMAALARQTGQPAPFPGISPRGYSPGDMDPRQAPGIITFCEGVPRPRRLSCHYPTRIIRNSWSLHRGRAGAGNSH